MLFILKLLLDKIEFTSASVDRIEKIWRLQESLLTASQFPEQLKARE